MFGPARGDTWWTYRLENREAVIVLGQLPPQGAYFGIQTYLFSRLGSINTENRIYHDLTDPFMRSILFMTSPNPSRVLVFSGLGDSYNNSVIERQSDAAFDQERSFIITPDKVTGQELKAALLRAGVPDRRHVFIEPVSSSLAQLGYGAEADNLMTIIRYALPADEAAGEKWRHQIPLVVLRVRNTSTALVLVAVPYSSPLREKRLAHSELELKSDAQNLVEVV